MCIFHPNFFFIGQLSKILHFLMSCPHLHIHFTYFISDRSSLFMNYSRLRWQCSILFTHFVFVHMSISRTFFETGGFFTLFKAHLSGLLLDRGLTGRSHSWQQDTWIKAISYCIVNLCMHGIRVQPKVIISMRVLQFFIKVSRSKLKFI